MGAGIFSFGLYSDQYTKGGEGKYCDITKLGKGEKMTERALYRLRESLAEKATSLLGSELKRSHQPFEDLREVKSRKKK